MSPGEARERARRLLVNRGYDMHPTDPDLFEELLDEFAEEFGDKT